MTPNHNVCVVGAGYWGKNHLKTLHAMNVLGGVVEQDQAIIKEIQEAYKGVNLYNNVEEAISAKKHTSFTVATPAKTHYEIAKLILSSKIPVLVEKPFTLSLEHAEELCAIAKNNSTCLMVGHLLLFHPGILKIKEWIKKGYLGDLNYIYSNRLNLGKVRSHEDVFWSLAPHDIAIMQFINESYPEDISYSNASFLQSGISDIQITNLKYQNNTYCHIFNSWMNPFKEHRLVISGDKGHIDFFSSKNDHHFEFYESEFLGVSEENQFRKQDAKKVEFEDIQPLENQFKYFLERAEKGELADLAGIDSALDVTKIMLDCC